MSGLNYRIYGLNGAPASGIRPWWTYEVMGW